MAELLARPLGTPALQLVLARPLGADALHVVLARSVGAKALPMVLARPVGPDSLQLKTELVRESPIHQRVACFNWKEAFSCRKKL